MTATPHKGDPENFSLFLQLLDRDAYADVRSIRQAMDAGRAPFYLRRTKEAMVYFPQRDGDGQWVTRKIFTKRIPSTVDFRIDGSEFELYREVTQFVKRQSIRAAADGDNPRARAVGFLMALYQRRLASSTRAMRRSLANRADRLERGLAEAEDLARTAPPDLPSIDELDEMEERDRERLERLLDAITLAGNAEMVREEITELRALAVKAHDVERAGVEAKLAKLEDLLRGQGFFGRPDQRLVIFTEFKDTLNYLVEKLEAWGFKLATIHGGMKPGARDEPGSRLHAEQQFREGAVQVLVATEAAGEGINLQVCNILFNYDIPRNPNRLEQRMGRIHRYGQEKHCLIFNFVATNTIEGHVLQRLLDKLQEIRDALDDDAVFNVVGEVLPAAYVERVLRDYYAGAAVPDTLPEIAHRSEPMSWLQEHVLTPFLEATRGERLAEIERVADHVELSLTELLQRTDEEIGRAAGDVDEGRQGAEGRLAMAEARQAELLSRRERRREEFQRQQALSLQGVERMTSVLVLPHSDRGASEVTRHQPGPETEATAMRVVMDHERNQGRHVEDVSAKNLGYDVTSLDTTSGDIRLIEVKGLAAATGTILLTPNERRVAEDRPDCYWLYVVTNCGDTPVLQEPIANPARFPWHKVTKVQHYYLKVDAMTRPMRVQDDRPEYGADT